MFVFGIWDGCGSLVDRSEKGDPQRVPLLSIFYASDECLKHSYYTRVSLAFSCCFGIIYIVLGVRYLI